MSERYDVCVVGSGFGGSVMAARLAEAGRRVAVLERGRAYPPGSFARGPSEVAAAFWDPSAGDYGMFNVWSFSGTAALVSSGLGGGSLIYANVMLRKDERWFVDSDADGKTRRWPVTRAELDPHYDRVEAMLGAQRFPYGAPGFEHVTKTKAWEDAGKALGWDFSLPKLAVSFRDGGDAVVAPGTPIAEAHPNLHGRPRYTCRLCGECDVGCNYGSKNSLDLTYLSQAQRQGAELRTLHEVRDIEPLSAPEHGFRVHFVRHDPTRTSADASAGSLVCKKVVLAAGTFGTTYLLLRNKHLRTALGPALGTRFSGNGDLLAFVRAKRPLHPSRGPVITSAFRFPDEVDGAAPGTRGMYLEDSGYPAFLGWVMGLAGAPGSASGALRLFFRRLWDRLRGLRDTDLGAELASLLARPAEADRLLPILGMGRDTPGGKMFLRELERLDLTWDQRPSAAVFDQLRARGVELAKALDGEYVANPQSWLKRLTTVHALGGCPMGGSIDEGVVDAWGQAFGVPGLVIADGSVMPGPVGPNPSLTIAALADRFADRLAAEHA